MSDLESTDSADTPEDLEKDQAGVVRRWVLELKLADKREKEWRKKAEAVIARYRQKNAKKHSFNILWSNTETLRPAVYNSLPKPDVRRRWKDEDELGKQVSTVLSRSLEYGLDTTDFNHSIENAVLDMLLPGRGVARVRYVPNLAQVGTPEGHDEGGEQHQAEGEEALEGDAEEVEWEQAPIEHVQWDDFRISSGKTWDEVCWIGFRHRLTRDQLKEKFGAIGESIKLDSTDDEEIEKEKDATVAEAFRTAEVWEIWNKDDGEVLFIAMHHKEQPLKVLPDPLGLQGFFPVPRPMYSIEDSATLVPVPLYELYKEQAEELDRISVRINKLVDGLKLRGIYDSTLSELSELMKGQDNDLIPAANVTALLERGGLEKAIWFIPIDQAAKVLQVLYEQREATKAVIYEITGIADIIRGASNASETATAQQIKDKWGSMRLRKMQSEVARFIRDLMRLQAEIIGEKFSVETLATMTGVKLPTQAEVEQQKQMQMAQYQQAAQQAQMSGQQPPPQPEQQSDPITWEAVMSVLKDDKQRSFKIDVETDSTIAASVEGDMKGLNEVLTAVAQTFEGLMPVVQMGALPIEALKEIIMAITRRAKLGNAVEDALEKMQQPPPQADPNAAKAQAEAQAQQQQMQLDQQRMAHEQQMEQVRMQMEEQRAQQEQAMQERQMQMDQQMEAQRMAAESERAQQQMVMDAAFERFKALLESKTKVEVAEIAAEATEEVGKANAARQGAED